AAGRLQGGPESRRQRRRVPGRAALAPQGAVALRRAACGRTGRLQLRPSVAIESYRLELRCYGLRGGRYLRGSALRTRRLREEIRVDPILPYSELASRRPGRRRRTSDPLFAVVPPSDCGRLEEAGRRRDSPPDEQHAFREGRSGVLMNLIVKRCDPN